MTVSRFVDPSRLPATEASLRAWLDLFDGDRLDDLPPGIVVDGDLDLSYRWRVTGLPRDLTVNGDLIVRGCHALRSLPDGLKATVIDAQFCYSLEHVGRGLRVHRLVLKFCDDLARLPDDMLVHSLSVHDCHCLPHIPINRELFVLDLVRCDLISDLSHVGVTCELVVEYCHNLRRLPRELYVDRLSLVGCSSLKELPSVLHTTRNAYISTCAHLEKMPRKLFVGDDLVISRCPKLRSLPADSEVVGEVILTDKPLISVPSHIKWDISVEPGGELESTTVGDALGLSGWYKFHRRNELRAKGASPREVRERTQTVASPCSMPCCRKEAL